jgi:hypothetical protein
MKLGGNERKKIKEEIILSYDEEIDGCSFFFELCSHLKTYYWRFFLIRFILLEDILWYRLRT